MVLALGYFDGFHLGHMALLNMALSLSKKMNTSSAILTFNEPVKGYINKEDPEYLLTINQKINIASDMGFDSIYIIELTDEFINLSKDEFIDLFLKDMKAIVVGFDYSYGKGGLGDTSYLKEVLKDKVYIIDEVKDNLNQKIGSKRIKEYLSSGDIEHARSLLGRDYILEGSIHRKNKNYSFNTLNYIPKSGYYKVEVSDYLNSIIMDAKLKKKLEDKEILIKTDNIEFSKTKFGKHNRFYLRIIDAIFVKN